MSEESTAMEPLYAIYHMQSAKGFRSWSVSFSRNGQMYTKRFFDLSHGGSDSAKAAAIAWRDEALATTPALTMLEFCQKKRSSNTSGTPGVHFMKSAAQPLGFWQAKLKMGGGKYLSKTFAVLKHGDHAAHELALAARAEMVASAQDKPYLKHPLAKLLAPKIRGSTKLPEEDASSP